MHKLAVRAIGHLRLSTKKLARAQVKAELSSREQLQPRGPLRFFPVIAHLLHAPHLRSAVLSERLIAHLADFLACMRAADAAAFASGPGADFKACLISALEELLGMHHKKLPSTRG